ncbi:S49 family peptidase [Hahella sp. CR1]|uniref:S49 family peptidase n=1 Tax=Hahella sp. CR1 TaxID=2992807 RepID=UPI00244148FD|nr:S49 family peptidase [Hahella sp. CR1]MDG9670891.1 S49 family peptidase [Hahella sp. CR1]
MPMIHLASRLIGTPLLIARCKLDVILAVVGGRIGLANPGVSLTPPAPRARKDSAPGIAVIPVHGSLVRRTLGLEAASGLSSYGQIAQSLDAAVADPQVAGILLDIDSPGGEAGGVFELAERIRAANARKPVWAHANDSAFSAAYAIAASAGRLSLSQTAGVGSVGVIALHVDQSAKDARDGLAYTALYAGEHKNDLSPHAPLSPEAASSLQAEVDRLYRIFVSQVAQMRNLSEDNVRNTKARLFFGEEAVSLGLADAVSSFDQTLSEFTDALRRQGALTPRERRNAHAYPRSSKELIVSEVPPETLPTHVDDPVVEASIEPASPPVQAPPYAQAQAIAELCLIAGVPQRTAEFLAAGSSEAQVRQVLLSARAEQPEIASRITAETGTQLRPEHSPVVAEVKRLAGEA